MSSLLNEAIVDAKALKEAALKNAEAAVIEKYSAEVKETLENLLEQEADLAASGPPAGDAGADAGLADADLTGDLDLGGDEEQSLDADAPADADADIAPDVPLSAVDDLEGGAEEGEPVEFSIDLKALQEAVTQLQSELDENEEIEITEENLADILSEEEDEKDELDEEMKVGASAGEQSAEEEEAEEKEDKDLKMEEDLDADSLVDAIMEKLTVDMGADLAGWAGRSSESIEYQMEKEMAHRRSTEVEEEMETLKKAQEELVFENNELKEKLSNYEQAVGQLKENLQDVNLSNARLLYTNRVLRNTSLNERQKTKIVEAISNAGSVTEARTIYDTLESTVQSTPKRGPQSLSEAITNRSSVIRATRKESTSSDPISDRMKRLAGIK